MWRLPRATVRRGLLFSLFALAGCNSESDSQDGGVLGPPSLAFLGATVSDGTTIEANAEFVELGCDARLTLHLGPRDESNELVNYRVRPIRYCGESDPCGFVRVSLLDSFGNVVSVVDAPLLDVVLDFRAVDARAVHTLHAELIGGISLEQEQVDGEPVEASWPLRLQPGDCPVEPPLGGAGGGP